MNHARDPRNPQDSSHAGHSPVAPLTPRPGLTVAMGILLVLLLGGLLALYFKTVYPYRNLPHAVETDKPAISAPTPAP